MADRSAGRLARCCVYLAVVLGFAGAFSADGGGRHSAVFDPDPAILGVAAGRGVVAAFSSQALSLSVLMALRSAAWSMPKIFAAFRPKI